MVVRECKLQSPNEASTDGATGGLQELPQGRVETSWSVSPGSCDAWDEERGGWRNTTTLPYLGSGLAALPSEDAVSKLGRRLCSKPEDAPEALADVLAGSPTSARAAIATLLTHECPDGPDALFAAFSGFVNATEASGPKALA